MAVDYVVFVAGVITGQGHEQGLPVILHDFLVCTNQLHTCFFSITKHAGACQRKMGAQRSVKHASKKSQKQQLPRASFSHFLELDFGGQQLEEATQSAPRCGGVDSNAHTVLHVRASGDGPVSLAMTHMR